MYFSFFYFLVTHSSPPIFPIHLSPPHSFFSKALKIPRNRHSSLFCFPHSPLLLIFPFFFLHYSMFYSSVYSPLLPLSSIFSHSSLSPILSKKSFFHSPFLCCHPYPSLLSLLSSTIFFLYFCSISSLSLHPSLSLQLILSSPFHLLTFLPYFFTPLPSFPLVPYIFEVM